MLPKGHGLSPRRQIRARGAFTPILLLTAIDAVESRIQGLDSGADDYLTKLFAFGELLARLRAIIRRGTRPIVPEILTVADLTIHTRTREATRAGRAIWLTAARNTSNLRVLRAPSRGKPSAGPDIAEHVWDEQYDQFKRDRRLRAAPAPQAGRRG